MYITVILFGSVYRKDGNYYSKVFLEKFILNVFREVNELWFFGHWKFLLRYKTFLKPGAR